MVEVHVTEEVPVANEVVPAELEMVIKSVVTELEKVYVTPEATLTTLYSPVQAPEVITSKEPEQVGV